MAVTRVKLNYSEVGRLLRAEGSYRGVRDMLTTRAEAVLAKARADAPVETGAYQAGLTIVQETTDRAAVRVAGTAHHSMFVEAATGNLARALDAAGGG